MNTLSFIDSHFNVCLDFFLFLKIVLEKHCNEHHFLGFLKQTCESFNYQETGNHQDIENTLFQLENDLQMNVSLCVSAEEGVALFQWSSLLPFPCKICKMPASTLLPPGPRREIGSHSPEMASGSDAM